MIPRAVVKCANELGESACWSAATQTLYWVDGVAATIHRWQPAVSEPQVIRLSEPPVGMIAPTINPAILVLTDRRGIALFDLEARTHVPIADPERGREGIGYNDGKVDPLGRLWIGTYDASEIEPRGCLWRLENGHGPCLADSGMAIVNGPTFSPDGNVLYVSDSLARRILAFDVEPAGLSGRRVLVECSLAEGLPDGLTTDADGCIWCAHWDGGRVTRFSPRGERLSTIPLPVPRVTSVAFGGEDLATLFVTTARYGLTAAQLTAAPDCGALFAVSPGVKGIVATPLPLPFACR